MNAHAPSLFDADSQTPVAAFPGVETGTTGAVPNASGRARATDPETSQAAAESITPVVVLPAACIGAVYLTGRWIDRKDP